jgi:hypothetical protein
VHSEPRNCPRRPDFQRRQRRINELHKRGPRGRKLQWRDRRAAPGGEQNKVE